jgi:hypothetical protein
MPSISQVFNAVLCQVEQEMGGIALVSKSSSCFIQRKFGD